ncbi:hypothetical protein [Acidipropionibacterium virtanenii]|uniref:Uncharacterized protein n=1 Tax=Acidipropionibacterium virtanenii TaxID=2057246 RepID=A0A344UQP3_9ACTN|nr:hypothetical protein [Acidipropionibacterium virtanenii]AXE37591.1 hypothetical protein JS278_00394 [Acidipropionibacterium virtanenii]
MTGLIEDRCLPMFGAASRIDDTDTRISHLQLDLGTRMAELRGELPESLDGHFCRAYLHFDHELESVRCGLEEVHDMLVRDARQCLASLSEAVADRPATVKLRG